jgi:hypothetical protein
MTLRWRRTRSRIGGRCWPVDVQVVDIQGYETAEEALNQVSDH